MWRGGREWSEKPYNARRLRQEVPHQKLSQCHLQPRTKSTLPSQHMHGRVAKLYWHQCSLERQLTSVCGCVDSVKGRSSSTTAHTSPASIVLKISLWTEMTAVSVEWCALQADWRDGKSCWDSMWTLHVSPAAAMRSTTFDKQLKLDSGPNEFASSGSSVGFFNRRRTTASFGFAGKRSSRNDVLQILASVSASNDCWSFTNHSGRIRQ